MNEHQIFLSPSTCTLLTRDRTKYDRSGWESIMSARVQSPATTTPHINFLSHWFFLPRTQRVRARRWTTTYKRCIPSSYTRKRYRRSVVRTKSCVFLHVFINKTVRYIEYMYILIYVHVLYYNMALLYVQTLLIIIHEDGCDGSQKNKNNKKKQRNWFYITNSCFIFMISYYWMFFLNFAGIHECNVSNV